MEDTIIEEKKYSRSLNIGRGCEFCSCEGEDTGVKICEGCQKLHVTDWLADYPAVAAGDIFEVRFKNTRRSYYQNVNNLDLHTGDIVAVEASPGHDIGIISLTGEMVGRQMHRVGFNPMNGEFKKIYRKAKPYDIEKWQEAMAMEHETMIRSRQIAADMNLNMKIGDVEYQGDKIKAIFYYIADERVDFRELIKVFAEEFHIRVEMKQIGARQEAGRIGGLGACGRELCCASWISGFSSVTTNAARAQEISLNPQKLAGQCSKLKCCLIYEYDDYMDARKEFPRVNGPLYTMDGEYHFIKNDILARTMSFSTAPGSMAGLVTLPIERVAEIIKLNARGSKPDKLEGAVASRPKESEPDFVNMVGEDSITRFDKEKKRRGGKKLREGDRPQRDGRGRQNDGERRQERNEHVSGGERKGAEGENRRTEGDRGQNRNERGRSGSERRGNGGERQRENDRRRQNNPENRQGDNARAQNNIEKNQNEQGRKQGGGEVRINANRRAEGRNENRTEGRGENRAEGRNDNRAESRSDRREEHSDNRPADRSGNNTNNRNGNRQNSGPEDRSGSRRGNKPENRPNQRPKSANGQSRNDQSKKEE